MKRFLVFGLVFWLAGCMYTKTTPYETRFPKPSYSPITVYDTLDSIPRPYKVIGEVSVRASSMRTPAEIIAEIKKQARQMGGDAVIMMPRGESPTGAIVPVGQFYMTVRSRGLWVAKVIVWR